MLSPGPTARSFYFRPDGLPHNYEKMTIWADLPAMNFWVAMFFSLWLPQTFTSRAAWLLLPAHFVDFARFEEVSPGPGLAGIGAGP